jgi:hypothetical protein
VSAKSYNLPQDREALEAMVRSLILEREQQKQRANDLQEETLRQTKRAEELYLQNLRLQLELERYKKWYYGLPGADRLSSSVNEYGAICPSILNDCGCVIVQEFSSGREGPV